MKKIELAQQESAIKSTSCNPSFLGKSSEMTLFSKVGAQNTPAGEPSTSTVARPAKQAEVAVAAASSQSVRGALDKTPASVSNDQRALGGGLQGASAAMGSQVRLAEKPHEVSTSASQPSTAEKLALGASLGALGFAVGIPYVPGITDNFIVAAIGVSAPFVAHIKDTPKDFEQWLDRQTSGS